MEETWNRARSTRTLDAPILEAIEALIRENVESCRSFQVAAGVIAGSPMAALFQEIARNRFRNAADLRRWVTPSRSPNRPCERRGSPTYRWREEFASSEGLGNPRAMLYAVERGEEAIDLAYLRTLEGIEEHPVRNLIREQELEVRRHREQVRDLRKRTFAVLR